MISTHEKVSHYSEALERWLKAKKEHPDFPHGPEPAVEDYGIQTEQEKWLANKTRERIVREKEREA